MENPQYFYGAIGVVKYKPYAPIPYPQTPFRWLALQFPHLPLPRLSQAVYRRYHSLPNLAGQDIEVILSPIAPANLPHQGKSR